MSSFKDPQYVKVSSFKYNLLEADEIQINLPNIEDKELINNSLLNERFYHRHIKAEEIILLHYNGKVIKIFIQKIIPIQNYCLSTQLTNLNISENQYYIVVKNSNWRINIQEKTVNINSIGNEKLLLEMEGFLNLRFKNIKDLIFKLKGIILYGPPRSGKTSLCFALAHKLNTFPINLKENDIFCELVSETEKKLDELFLLAKSKSPSLIIIDDIEKICPKIPSNHLHKRILSKLIKFLDNLENDDSCVLFIGNTTKPDDIHPSLIQLGRFQNEYELEPPDEINRCKILESFIVKHNHNHNINKEEIMNISRTAVGFVAGDLVILFNKALRLASNENKTLCQKHLLSALSDVTPSAAREVMLTVPKVKWTDIGGRNALKLERAIIWPLKYPEKLKKLGINPNTGFLLFGPPGCGKTLMVEALATESKLNFLYVKGPELLSKWVGESERAMQHLFRRARRVSPSIVFFDEIEVIASARSSSSEGSSSDAQARVLTQLLTELDGVKPLGDVIVVGATNRPDKIDPALLRPGRLSKLYVPLPDKNTRREILSITFGKMAINDDVKIEYLVEQTDGFSGAEVHALCQEAGWKAFEEDTTNEFVNLSHFLKALKDCGYPRTKQHLIEIYNKFINEKP